MSPTERSRIATSADAGEVAELLDRFQTEFDEYTPGAEVLAPRIREHIASGLSVFLLAGPPHGGTAQLRFREYLLTGTPMCYLEELYVVPRRRGQGHGRMLMQSALDTARERGATTMELGTAASDTAARAVRESGIHQPGETGQAGDAGRSLHPPRRARAMDQRRAIKVLLTP